VRLLVLALVALVACNSDDGPDRAAPARGGAAAAAIAPPTPAPDGAAFTPPTPPATDAGADVSATTPETSAPALDAGAAAVDAGPAYCLDAFCSRCAAPLADLHAVMCRPGCGSCNEGSQLPVDACWADGWFQCVHTCDECR